MFTTIQNLWLAFAGKLKKTKESRVIIWLLLITFLAGWACTAYAAWISYPSYQSIVKFVPGSWYIAGIFTGAIAGFLYFALAYLAMYFVQKWRNKSSIFSKVGPRIIGVAACLFLLVDAFMNWQGTTHRAEDLTASYVNFAYSTPEHIKINIASRQKEIIDLLGGNIGGYGWRDPKTLIYHLNQSGKQMHKRLDREIASLVAQDSAARAEHIIDKRTRNSERLETHRTIKKTLENSVYGVYILVFLASLVQAYLNQTVFDETGTQSISQPSIPAKGFQMPAMQRPANPSESRFTSLTLTDEDDIIRKGDKCNCDNCGKEYIATRKGHRFCSSACRTSAWKAN